MMTFLFGVAVGLLIPAVGTIWYLRKKHNDYQEDIKLLHTRLNSLGGEVEIIKRIPPNTEASPPSSFSKNSNATYHPVFTNVEFENEIPKKEASK